MALPVTKNLLNEIEAGAYLGVSQRCMQSWRHHGRGPTYHKLGAQVRYSRADLDAFVESGRVEPANAGTGR